MIDSRQEVPKDISLKRFCAFIVIFLVLVLVIPALGIPPTPPYKALADRAEKEGVAAVRGEFRSMVEGLTAEFDSWQGPPKSLDEFSRRLSTVNLLFSFLHTWAHVEARAIREKGAVDPQVLLEACEPALASAARAIKEQEKLKGSVPGLRRSASPQELNRSGWVLNSLPNSDRTRDDMVQRLIAMTYLVGDHDLLKRSFQETGEEARTSRTADQYLKHPPDLEKLFGSVKKPNAKIAPQGVLPGAVTPEEEAAIRDLIDRYGQALVDRDSTSFQALFLDPNKFGPFQAQLGQADFVHFDTSTASFRFQRLGADSIRVYVDGIVATRQKGKGEVKNAGRKTFRVTMRNGQAFLDGIGDSP